MGADRMLRSVSTMHVMNTVREAQARREVPVSRATQQVDASSAAVVHNVVEMLLVLGLVIARDVNEDAGGDAETTVKLIMEKWNRATPRSRAVVAETNPELAHVIGSYARGVTE